VDIYNIKPWREVLNDFSGRLSNVALFAGLSPAPNVSFTLGIDVRRYPSDAMSRLLTRKKGARK
jgi:hypothetical protein